MYKRQPLLSVRPAGGSPPSRFTARTLTPFPAPAFEPVAGFITTKLTFNVESAWALGEMNEESNTKVEIRTDIFLVRMKIYLSVDLAPGGGF